MIFTSTRIEGCALLKFPRISDSRGCLTPITGRADLPFDIRRVFYLYDVPSNAIRGGHAHVHCHQILLAINGSFEVLLDDGEKKRIVSLHHPHIALHIPPGIWAAEINFEPGTVCLVLASHEYQPEEYIHDYNYFKSVKQIGMPVVSA